MKKIYFIYDVGPQSRLNWLAYAFKDENFEWIAMNYNDKNRVYRWRKIIHFYNYIELAIKTLKRSSKGDYIISWNFIVGAFLAFLCHLFRIERTILSLNMISHDKQGIIAFIRRKVYNYAFAYSRFHFTVNAEEVLEQYQKEYNIDRRKVSVLPDPYLPVYSEKEFDPQGDYIFCGGEAQRDWNTFFEAAKKLPHLKFVGVARRKYMSKHFIVPSNVQMYYDIAETEFDSLLEKSLMVALPLLTLMPAGLIVVYKSIFMSKPIITTNTPPIRNYLSDGDSAILLEIGDVDGLINAIKKISSNESFCRHLTDNARKMIIKYSPESYSNSMYQILFGNSAT